MLQRLLLMAITSSLLGCAGLQPAYPPEFSGALPGGVLAAPDAMDVGRSLAAAVPAALLLVDARLGYAPQRYTVLVCRTSCFKRHVPVPGAAAAQTGDKIFINADLVVNHSIVGVLAHELAHIVIDEQRGQDKAPVWANEAIAVWVSGTGTRCDGASERLQRHPMCFATRASEWIGRLAQNHPRLHQCWLRQMLSGLRVAACPDVDEIYEKAPIFNVAGDLKP